MPELNLAELRQREQRCITEPPDDYIIIVSAAELRLLLGLVDRLGEALEAEVWRTPLCSTPETCSAIGISEKTGKGVAALASVEARRCKRCAALAHLSAGMRGGMMRRLWHHFVAWFLGYFWLPCPICGEYFRGHEGKYQALMVSPSSETSDGSLKGKMVCPKPSCIAEARRLNYERFNIRHCD